MGTGTPRSHLNGGWSLSKDKCYILDAGLARYVASRMSSTATIVDLGAGLGCYTQYMRHHGANVTIALDFAVDVDVRTDHVVTRWDLSVPYPFPLRPDWSFIVEVAEHIPSALMAGFMQNVAAARCGALLSWARPGQGGSGHVNERNATYVTHLMQGRGLSLHHNYTLSLRHHATLSYIKRNVAAYVRDPFPLDCRWKTQAGEIS